MTRPANVPARPLVADRPQQRSFADDTPHAYTVEVAAGDLLRVTAEQLGADVKVHLFAPDGRQVMVMDSPTGTEGPETASAVAETAGTWRVEVHPFDHGPGADYEIRIDDLRPAGAADRQRVAAEQAFAAGEELRRDDDFASALERFRSALQGWQAVGERTGEGYALQRMGWMEIRLGEREQGISHLRQAVGRLQEIGDEDQELTGLNLLATGLRRERMLKDALRVHARAVTLARRLGDDAILAESLLSQGDTLRWAGRTHDAIDGYREAMELFETLGAARRRASVLVRLGEVYLTVNRLDEATALLERATESARTVGWQGGEIAAEELLGRVYYRQERLEEAEESLERVLTLAHEMEDRSREALARSSLGTLRLKLGQVEQAERHFETARDLFRELEDRQGEAMMLHKLGRLRFQEGALDEALELHETAAEVFKRAGDRQGVASTRYGAARILHDQGRYRRAHELLRSIIRSAEELRTESASHDLRTSYVDSKHHYWELHIDTLMHLRDEEQNESYDYEALAASERWRARSLVEMLFEAGLDDESGLDEAVRLRYRNLQDELSAVAAQRMEVLDEDAGEQLHALDREQMRLLMELDHVRAEMRRSSRLHRQLDPLSDDAAGSAARLPQIQQNMLDGRTLAVVYSLGDERSFGWTVTQRQVLGHVLPGRQEIEGLADRVRQLLVSAAASNAEQRREVSALLSQRILAPLFYGLADAGRFQRLVVVADGSLLYVPFAALPMPKEADSEENRTDTLLVQRFEEIVNLPSLSVLLPLRNMTYERQLAARSVVALADPVFQPDDPRLAASDTGEAVVSEATDALTRSLRNLGRKSLQRLPGTRQEAEAILEMAPRDGLGVFGFDANRELVTGERLRSYRILHFATHGLVNSEHPELSGLALSMFDEEGEPVDGFLRLHELYGLRLPAELVVLSACDTGLGQELRGEGLVGLARGFMFAGSPRVVVSLWEVGDEDTAELMRRFYEQLLEHKRRPSLALRLAQSSMLEDEASASPHRWAGFVFLGDWKLSTELGSGTGPPDDSIEGKQSGVEPDQTETETSDDLPGRQ